jgi:hypothetical protein
MDSKPMNPKPMNPKPMDYTSLVDKLGQLTTYQQRLYRHQYNVNDAGDVCA